MCCLLYGYKCNIYNHGLLVSLIAPCHHYYPHGHIIQQRSIVQAFRNQRQRRPICFKLDLVPLEVDPIPRPNIKVPNCTNRRLKIPSVNEAHRQECYTLSHSARPRSQVPKSFVTLLLQVSKKEKHKKECPFNSRLIQVVERRRKESFAVCCVQRKTSPIKTEQTGNASKVGNEKAQ